MIASMSKKNDGELGFPKIQWVSNSSLLSLKNPASKQPAFILKDGRKVSLNLR
jgi:hypothetical protein